MRKRTLAVAAAAILGLGLLGAAGAVVGGHVSLIAGQTPASQTTTPAQAVTGAGPVSPAGGDGGGGGQGSD